MTEKELKYMGTTTKYREVEIPFETDNYGRKKVIKVAKQSNAQQITDDSTGVMSWTGGAFLDMFINGYIKDEDYDELSDEELIELSRKMKF